MKTDNVAGADWAKAFTLVELLVVISIISILMAIVLPVFSGVKLRARSLLGANNQKQVVGGVSLFASDNDDRYPPSVATVSFNGVWNWTAPTKLVGNERRSLAVHRSMGEYLGAYIGESEILACPSAPSEYKYLQEAWVAGDQWDNPDTGLTSDPVGGTYCLYWNYTGYLGTTRTTFDGPRGPAAGGNQSKLLISDYFGYDCWRSPKAYGSCDKMAKADVVQETQLLSSYWVGDATSARPEMMLRAGYTDGHVESYSTSEVIEMRVSLTSDGKTPYPDGGWGPGVFYLPADALH